LTREHLSEARHCACDKFFIFLHFDL
jgi:hypothetical protein